jgi:hypothetical protein
MPKQLVLTVFLTLVMVMAAPANAQDASPPFSTWPTATPAVGQKAEPSVRTVTAIVVKSWGDNPVWADLNTNWSTYGKIAVSIDHTTLIKSDFTYQDLVNSQADVVIISDAAGGNQQYSSTEMAAVAKYAKQSHPILATYATFQYSSYDNRGLAPLFGLDSTLTYTTTGISNKFDKVTCSCLLKKIHGSSWQSNGYNYSQVPSSDTWKGNLGKAKAVADSDTFVGVITVHTTKTSAGVYISNMPEYENVGGDDEQLLYNAITCYAKGGTK